MDKVKLKATFEEFKQRDAERVKEMQQQVLAEGGDLGPDLVLMVLVDRVKDLSTLLAVLVKEVLDDDAENPVGSGQIQ